MAYDRRHIFNAAYSAELPSMAKGNLLLKGLANGWQISGTTQLQSGATLQPNFSMNFGMAVPAGSPLTSRTVTGTASVGLQPLLTCNPAANLKDHQYVNGSCFALPTPGNNGPIFMPEMFGPAFLNSDLSAFKNSTSRNAIGSSSAPARTTS